MYQDKEKNFDIRVLEKHFPIDALSREQYDRYVQNLPDVSEKIDHEYQFSFTSPRRGGESLSSREEERKEIALSESPSHLHSPDTESRSE